MFNRIEDPVDAKMSKMMSKESYYESGEEKFGILSTSLYNLFNLNPVIRKFYGFMRKAALMNPFFSEISTLIPSSDDIVSNSFLCIR